MKLIPKLLLLTTVSLSAYAQDDKPLLTIGCISDFHNSSTLIDKDNIDELMVRGSLTKTCLGMYNDDDIDVMLIGGDCTSEADLTLDIFNGLKQLVRRTTATAFHNPDDTPVLIATGNHDYEAARKDADGHRIYDSGDYYTSYMQEDVGKLISSETFFEEGKHNGGKLTVRAAYHYKLKGYDFISLNCGKHEFESSSNYQYSMESIQWVAKKLEEICADDPYKTVFFFLHIPFNDSNSLRYENKGIRYSPAEYLLKQTLAKYPNLIMLYGHDHGGDKAYSRRSTAQRVTLYNTDGEVIPTFDATHVEGPTTDPENDDCNTQHRVYLQNKANRQYMMKHDDNGLAFQYGKRTLLTFTRNPDGTWTISINENSINFEDNHFHEGIASAMTLFKVESIDGTTVTATKATELEIGAEYLVAHRNGRYYYAISNTTYPEDNRNLNGVQLSGTSSPVSFTGATLEDMESLIWIPRDDSNAKRYYVKSAREDVYLNGGESNLSMVSEPVASIIRRSNDDDAVFNIEVVASGGDTDGGKQVRNGTNGGFSLNKVGSDFYLYKVVAPEASNIECVRTDEIVSGENYVLVGQNQIDSLKYYALCNSENTSIHRMNGREVTPEETIKLPNRQPLYQWTLTEKPQNLEPSFFSAFMGSMRHYTNVANSDMVQTATPEIVQALLIYVYEDRVELKMKNYNRTGKWSSVAVNKDLATYTVYRKTQGEESGINEIPTSTPDHRGYYDLLGRRVEKPTHGIYIHNGKKVIFK